MTLGDIDLTNPLVDIFSRFPWSVSMTDIFAGRLCRTSTTTIWKVQQRAPRRQAAIAKARPLIRCRT